MTDAVETMAYTGEVPWHGQGNPVRADMSAAEMMNAASLNWGVVKRAMYHETAAGGRVKMPATFALCRDSDDKVLTVVGSKYKPIQNAAAFEFFKEFVDAGNMTMETAGSLWEGRYVWGLARVKQADFKVGKNDAVQNYLLLCSPHIQGKAMSALFTSVRVVCWNTLSMALGSSLGKLGAHRAGFTMPHTRHFDATAKEQAKVALGLAKDQAVQMKEAATMLAKASAKAEQVEQYFCEVLRFDPKQATLKKDESNREPLLLPKFREALDISPGAQLSSARGTWWGALNAVTAVIDHNTGRDRGTALRNAWLGNHANTKRRALDLALEAAK